MNHPTQTELRSIENEVMRLRGSALDVGLNLRDALGCYRHLVHTILDTESEKINSLLIRSIIRSIESLDFSCATYAPIATDSADQQGLEP